MSPFQDSELTTILVVADLERAKTFYLEVLGASLHREYGGTSAVLQFLGNWVLLVTPGGPTADKPDTHFVPPESLDRVHSAFTIQVKSCQESYDMLRKRGAAFITPPYDWGAEVRCFFHDPDGHLFEISEWRG
ncbi:MAG: VOC family protein [Bacteroidota bacterium]